MSTLIKLWWLKIIWFLYVIKNIKIQRRKWDNIALIKFMGLGVIIIIFLRKVSRNKFKGCSKVLIVLLWPMGSLDQERHILFLGKGNKRKDWAVWFLIIWWWGRGSWRVLEPELRWNSVLLRSTTRISETFFLKISRRTYRSGRIKESSHW